MKKIIRLTESDITRIVKKVILEQLNDCDEEWKGFLGKFEKLYKSTPKSTFCKKINFEGFVKLDNPYFDSTKLPCLKSKFQEWCKSE